ncbi:MAG: DUF934 domain-containing protein [Burkholderiales bacterium]|jgi:uncharacterized protein (DUF934 family)|nr:DUF934 domain-containing protein [Burkholderiales bacterium]
MKFIEPQQDPLESAWGGADPAECTLMTLEQWQAVRRRWPAMPRIGVVLSNDQDVALLEPDLPRLALVVLQFPTWTDGRAYTQARLLRTRLRFTREIRASGEVLVDMLPMLQRTGFDAVQLRADQSRKSARHALRFFADHYQGDANEPRPLFARCSAQMPANVGD